MQFIDRYPIIVTDRLAECRDFWVAHLGFSVVFENKWFIYLQADGASIAFMSPSHPSSPPGPEPYVAGISMELEVADAVAALVELRASGREPDYPLTDEVFGQAPVFGEGPIGAVGEYRPAAELAGGREIWPDRDGEFASSLIGRMVLVAVVVFVERVAVAADAVRSRMFGLIGFGGTGGRHEVEGAVGFGGLRCVSGTGQG